MAEKCPYCGAGRSHVLPFGEVADGLFQCGTSAKDGEVAVRGQGCLEGALNNAELELSFSRGETKYLDALLSEIRAILAEPVREIVEDSFSQAPSIRLPRDQWARLHELLKED